MKTVGIIAEYNPFHNGHLYQIKKAKEMTKADYTIVIMSGDFTQRGEQAIVNKYTRCEMALNAGADLVIELPVCYATGSAEFFALGAVALLDRMHTDYLCFGSECGDIAMLSFAADILYREPEDFKACLKAKCSEGFSFPKARGFALRQILSYSNQDICVFNDQFWESPNNILGIEYLKALLILHSEMKPLTVKREGMGYSSAALTMDSYSSALSIRNHLYSGGSFHELIKNLPPTSLSLLSLELDGKLPLQMDDFSQALFYSLLKENQGYESFFDLSQAISNKIENGLGKYQSYTQFASEILKTKDVTLTRINRCLLHILLQLKEEDIITFKNDKIVYYARILGFKKNAAPVLRKIHSKDLLVIDKLSNAEEKLTDSGKLMLSQDIFAAALYEGISSQKNGRPMIHEYSRPIIII